MLDKFSGRGFTLIEILLVISLIALIFSFTVALGFDSYRRNSLKTERDTLVSILQKARSQAINNIDDSRHGFYFDGTNYIVFAGDSFDPLTVANDLVVKKNPSIEVIVNVSTEINGLKQIVFNQLTGNIDQTASLVLSDGISSSTISINQEGRINW
jgi:prepilin-type N-terminal cleavage/methylation domain-containing protein